MIIRDRRQDYSDRNANYHKDATTLVGDIFQTETEYPDYISSAEFKSKLHSAAVAAPNLTIVEQEYDRPSGPRADFSWKDLGAYERVIFSSLAWGQYSVYCVVGEMGSGKTAVVKHLVKVLRRERPTPCDVCDRNCQPVILRIDFNEGFTSTAPRALQKAFSRRLHDQLRAELRAQFQTSLKVDDFVAYAQQPEQRTTYAAFDVFFAATQEDAWKGKSGIKRANLLFGFISNADDIELQLEMLMRLLRYVAAKPRPEPACAVLICDNIDKLPTEAQMTIFLYMLSLQRHARIRTLITLRRTSFEKLASQRAYSFGVINHNGPEPLLVAKARLAHFVNAFDTDAVTAHCREAGFARFLRQRLRYVLTALDSGAGAHVVELFRGLSGESIRQGLHIVQRMFINVVTPYDTDPRNVGELSWALLAGKNPSLCLELKDDLVANVYTDGKESLFSLLCIRILGLLTAFEDSPENRTLANLAALLQAIGGWSYRQVIDSANYLMRDKRPLI
jgi:hypothetical protein